MANHPNPHVDTHVKKLVGDAGFSMAGANATLGAGVNLSSQQLHDLIDGANQQKFEVKVVNGNVVIYPRG